MNSIDEAVALGLDRMLTGIAIRTQEPRGHARPEGEDDERE